MNLINITHVRRYGKKVFPQAVPDVHPLWVKEMHEPTLFVHAGKHHTPAISGQDFLDTKKRPFYTSPHKTEVLIKKTICFGQQWQKTGILW